MDFGINAQQYGDVKKREDRLRDVPLERRNATEPMRAHATRQDQGQQEDAPIGFGTMAPHTQYHMWALNWLMKKLHEPRPSVPGLDEAMGARIMAAQVAINLAEETGDRDIHDLANEIMEGQDDPYKIFGLLSAAKMDDIDIAEGNFGILRRDTGLVQTESDIRSADEQTKDGGTGENRIHGTDQRPDSESAPSK